jgi:hypothetical protein
VVLDTAAFSAFNSVMGTLKKSGGEALEKLKGLIQSCPTCKLLKALVL